MPTLARSQSIGSLADLADSRPVSHGDPLAKTKRSALSRVASMGQLYAQPMETVTSVVEQQNRNVLSRIVMAGMRMYGLSQRRKSGGRPRTISEVLPVGVDAVSSPVDGENEYKMVYHQTFKAAAFAVRRQIGSVALSSDALRDIVDRLLAIFCIDPTDDGRGNGIAVGKDSLRDTGFDPPGQEGHEAHIDENTNTAGLEPVL